MKPHIGYQVYSAREDAVRDFAGTLKAIAGMGYDGVEFAGFYGADAASVSAMLRSAGLAAASSHVPFAQILSDPMGVIDYHKAIGCPVIAVPYLEESRRPGTPLFAETIRCIAEFGSKCRDNGIRLLYHNHDFEFAKVSGQYGLDFLYDAIPASLLQTELDTCWIRYAGEDPVSYLKKYAGRAPVVHLKDYVGVKSDRPPYALIGLSDPAPAGDIPFRFKPFGHGCQDAAGVIKAAVEAGAEWVIVEQDESTERAPLDDARLSIETVRKYL